MKAVHPFFLFIGGTTCPKESGNPDIFNFNLWAIHIQTKKNRDREFHPQFSLDRRDPVESLLAISTIVIYQRSKP